MRYLYGVSDTQFPKSADSKSTKKQPLDTFQFKLHPTLSALVTYDKKDVSILFKATPDTLLQLAANVVDAMPLPCALEWNNWQVCRFIRNIGYPQYQRTFRKNLIHGRSLLLLDASALIAMNITNWEHIKHITFLIRCLYHFELTKFASSISLPYQHWQELYVIFRSHTSALNEQMRRTDFWRMWGLLRRKPENLNHFEKLERWLAFYKDPRDYEERFGGAPLYGRLYKECKKYRKPVVKETTVSKCICNFCDCAWNDPTLSLPWNLKLLERPPKVTELNCSKCVIPPCTCQWKSTEFMPPGVHSILTCFLSNKYVKGRRLLAHSFVKH